MGAEVEGKGCEGEVEQDNGGETEQKRVQTSIRHCGKPKTGG